VPDTVIARAFAQRRRLSLGLIWAAAAGLLTLAALAGSGFVRAAAPTQPALITLTARAGFDGYYKELSWLPVRIIVGNDGPDVHGTLRVAIQHSGGADVVVTRAVDLPTQSRREVFLYIPSEGFLSSLQIGLADATHELASTTARLVQAGPNDLIYGVLAGSPSAFNVLTSVGPVGGGAHVAQLDAADLPPVSYAWRSLDVLVVSDVDTGVLTPEQRAALAGWVATGGRLIVGGGPTWQKTAAGLGSLLPLSPTGTQTLPDASALAAFASGVAPDGPVVAATGSLGPDAVALASAGGLPLVVARYSGFGQVLFLAVDPSFEPLKNWNGLEGLYRNLLTGTAQRPGWAAGLRNWNSARDAIGALPGLQLPSALQICGFLGLYILAVGPINYYVLRRFKRRELAWLSIPLLVIVFSVGAYLTGNQLRGSQASLHRLAVVQVWPDANYARVDGLVGLFSPRRTQYDIGFGAGFLARPMPSDTSIPTGSGFTVEQADATVIRGVRVEVGAVAPFVVQGQVAAPLFVSDLTMDVTSSQVTLRGTLANHSNLKLTDAVLLAPGGVQRLGDLAAGAVATVTLPLTDSRASLAPPNEVLPALASAGSQNPPPSTPGSNYDSTVDDILGNTYYYNDREQFRRYSLLSAIIDSYVGNVRGNGVYLVGWSDQSPVLAQVLNGSFRTVDSSLYLVSLRPKLNLGTGVLAIPPGLMTWITLDGNPQVAPTPYDMYLYPGTNVSLRFTPAQLLPHDKIQGLTLHLLSYGQTGAAGVTIDLWDIVENNWVRQTALAWGDTSIAHPEKYVGPAGQIQVRADNPSQAPVRIERLDFTLFVGQ
jgi:hypothetical protein